ncbi:ABC-2 family transporter protein [Cohnella sp. AR92]|uniref:ABC transporter permease n=1 Tax=Cohnella sp. AR92 TaxID=648716 RepID=UPI000F8D315C|nr:ABC-2 family transporter protein [Cohnella sp. AR92]RUS46564.1 daunorubicin ABC transporter permease [Cohnella sp. AR92]
MVSAYFDFVRIRFLTMLAYRINYYSGIVIYCINIGAYYFMWRAIYGDAETLGGFTVAQMTTYIAVSWMARAFYFNNLDREISNEIRDGSVAVQMMRPISYLLVKMMQGFGEGAFRMLLLMVPGMIVATLLFPVTLPTDPMRWFVFFIMLWFSFLINTQLNLLTGLFAFFVENNEGLMRMKRVLIDLLSGVLLPLTFFPGWARTILEWLPFQAITYLPSSVFTGRLNGVEVWNALYVQMIWFLALIVPILLMWRSARKRLFVQGG